MSPDPRVRSLIFHRPILRGNLLDLRDRHRGLTVAMSSSVVQGFAVAPVCLHPHFSLSQPSNNTSDSFVFRFRLVSIRGWRTMRVAVLGNRMNGDSAGTLRLSGSRCSQSRPRLVGDVRRWQDARKKEGYWRQETQ